MSQISGITDEDSKYEVFINAIKDATRVATGTKRCDAHRKKMEIQRGKIGSAENPVEWWDTWSVRK